MHALVNAARGMREAKLLVDDPMRRAEMAISDEGLIEQIETDGNGARDDLKENFLFMLSEEAKVQKSKRLNQAKFVCPAQPGNKQSDESDDATAAVEAGGDGSANSPTEGSAVSEMTAEGESTKQEPRFLLADAGYLGRNNDQGASFVLQWNGVVQAQLCEGVESCADSLEIGLVKGQLLSGNNKWSGGVLAADGNIYGIPYNAMQVLCFDPRTQQATRVGAGEFIQELLGDNKWQGGVLAANGNIYGIPYNATQVLRFDPRTQQATRVLRFDPRTQQATLVGPELPGDGNKWEGGVLAADGNIYGIPYNATQVLRFDPRTQQATLVGGQLPGGDKWSGGVLAADGNIYGIPHNATQVLCFDPLTQQATFVGGQLPGGDKWSGGVLAADGNIYGIPKNATQVLRFDPRTQQATRVGAELPGGDYKWQGGVLAADGNIYGIPIEATQVLSLAMNLPKVTAELVLELGAQSSYARLEKNVESQPLRGSTSRTSKQTEKTLRLDACGCGAYVRLVPQEGYELGMGQIGISVTIERKHTSTMSGLATQPEFNSSASPAQQASAAVGGEGAVARMGGGKVAAASELVPGSGSDSAELASSAQPASAVLLSAGVQYNIKLPEARFGIIAQDYSYTSMMDENEQECLRRFCRFADSNPRRLKRIINVFNVGRRVVELRRGKEWSGMAAFKPKLLKFVIMLEQWPYRAPARPKGRLPPM
eukprot:scaffold67357_cov67-Phaeocystis_antarctica.AAC.1